MKRLFFAVFAGGEIKDNIEGLQQELSRRFSGVKWVEPANLHFTLRFLGDIEESMVPQITRAAFLAAGRITPFSLTAAGLGSFPRVAPRVIWLGVKAGGDRLSSLAGQLDRCLETTAGIERDQKVFRAHLTLGRVRQPLDPGEWGRALTDYRGFTGGWQGVNSFCLVASMLTGAGPVYTPLAGFTLKGKI